ncbi:MAG: autotransporter domain-containing protein [Rhizobiaceae bacterium]|nr:autotransporter domain-containing protein [Rhizobiaceae bacterium]
MGVGPLLRISLSRAPKHALAYVCLAFVCTSANAQSFTISNGETSNAQQTVGPGGLGLIEALGTLNVVGGIPAITNAGDNITVNNAGLITSLGVLGAGVLIDDNSTVTNSGTIQAAFGIVATGNTNTVFNSGTILATCCGIGLNSNNVVTNTGTIISTGDDAIVVADNNTIFNSGTISGSDDGIEASNNNHITNTGTITTTGDHAIFVVDNNIIVNSGTLTGNDEGIDGGNNNHVTNTGTIIANDDGMNLLSNNTVFNSGSITARDDGIDIGGGSTITNTGTITSTGDDGVDIEGAGTTLINSGTITGFEAGVDSDSANTKVINSGSVINSNGPGQMAYEFSGGAGDHLVFLNSPLTVGRIVFGDDDNDPNDGDADGDTVEFQVAGGRSLDVTFSPLPPNVVHDASIQSTVVDRANNRVIYVDPTGFAANSVWLDSLSRSVFNAVTSANDGSGANSLSNAYFLQTGDASAVSQARPYRAWASGFATASRQMRSGVNGELTALTGGALFGFDADVSAQTRFGLFGGVTHGRMKVENGHQDIDTTGGLLGAYADWTDGDMFGNFILFGGLSEQNSKRDVANNTVAGGIESAKADYAAAFISPALTFGKQLTEFDDGTPLLGSVRLHYSGMWLNGYTESGVTNPVTVNDRTIHRLGARAQLSFPDETIAADGGPVRIDRRAGIDYTFSPQSQNVSGSVVGLPLNFEAEFDNQGPAGFLGFDVTRVLSGGNRVLKAGSEARLASDGSIEFRVGLSFRSFF